MRWARDPLRRCLRGGGLELPVLAEETRSALAALLPVEASTANPVDMPARRRRAATGASCRRAGRSRHRRRDRPLRPTRRGRDGGCRRRDQRCRREKPGQPNPCSQSILASEGAPATLRRPPRFPLSPIRRLRRGRSDGRRSEPTGCAGRRERFRHSRNRSRCGGGRCRRALSMPAKPGWAQEAGHCSRRTAFPWSPSARPQRPTRLLQPPRARLPVVVKAATAGAHKTETGGVALDLPGPTRSARRQSESGAPHRAADDPRRRRAARRRCPRSGLRPARRVRARGVHAELIGDAQFRATPLTDVDADELVEAGKAGRLVAGFRGRRRPTRRRWPTSCTGCPGWQTTCPSSRSSTSTPCSAFPTAPLPSMPASGSPAHRAVGGEDLVARWCPRHESNLRTRFRKRAVLGSQRGFAACAAPLAARHP